MLPKKELPEVVQWYKEEVTGNALLNRAGHLAAKKMRLLADPQLEAAEAVQQTQPISRALQEATKRLRQLPEGEGQGGMAVDEEEEDDNLVSTTLEKWMKRMVQSRLKCEPMTPQPPPPPPTPRSTLKRTSSSTVPPKKKKTKPPTRTVSPKKTGPPPEKKKKSFMRGMLDESLLAGY